MQHLSKKIANSLKLYFISFLVGALFVLPASAQVDTSRSIPEAENIDMFVGEVRSLGKQPVSRVAVGAGKVLRAQVVTGGELIVIAEGEGSSSLRLWYKDGSQHTYNIRVSLNDPEQRVLMQDMIRVKVQMVEVNKNAAKDLGINWGEFAAGPTFATIGDFASNDVFRAPANFFGAQLPLELDGFETYFGLATAINSRINYLDNQGELTIIAEPTLTVLNGGSANFLAGGEIPYSTVSTDGQVDVEFKEYGIKLEVFPRANRDGYIYSRIVAEISTPDEQFDLLAGPALLTRKTESQMNVRAGQTIVLSGLLNAETRKANESLPGMGKIPVLKYLFGNERADSSITEIVVFVTPEIVPHSKLAGSEQQIKLYNQTRETLQKLGKKLDYDIMEY